MQHNVSQSEHTVFDVLSNIMQSVILAQYDFTARDTSEIQANNKTCHTCMIVAGRAKETSNILLYKVLPIDVRTCEIV